MEEKYKIIYFDQLESTNKYAIDNISSFENGTVICAKEQTGGYGRFKRNWISDGQKNLYFSIILKPSDTLKEDLPLANITQYMSVVLAELMQEYGANSEIKWPNDVKINGKKAAGILSEASIQGDRLKGIVVGVGININSDEKIFENIDQPATSLSVETGKKIDKDQFLKRLTDNFFKEYDEFMEKGFEFIKKRYTSKCSFLQKEILVKNFNKEQKGTAVQINDDGSLLLDDKGNKSVVIIGDIVW